MNPFMQLIRALILDFPDIVKVLRCVPKKVWLKACAFISFFGTGGLMFFYVTDADIVLFLDYICNSRLYKFFANLYSITPELDPSINPTKKEDEHEEEFEDSENKKNQSQTKNKFFKPESPTEIKVAVIVVAIFGIPYLIFKIFFDKK